MSTYPRRPYSLSNSDGTRAKCPSIKICVNIWYKTTPTTRSKSCTITIRMNNWSWCWNINTFMIKMICLKEIETLWCKVNILVTEKLANKLRSFVMKGKMTLHWLTSIDFAWDFCWITVYDLQYIEENQSWIRSWFRVDWNITIWCRTTAIIPNCFAFDKIMSFFAF